jgi:LmbE family N-acetylglucosaminyl deacetylase
MIRTRKRKGHFMNRLIALLALFAILALRTTAQEQKPQQVPSPDERFKTDILVVVAHPDDEGAVTPYLARAIYDEHKRVAVVFGTRGGSGGNDYAREHGPALADIREQEGRLATSALGITNVWFLDGKDTASQNVLNSLANWGHGANLERLVRIVRITRPEVILAWLPGVFIGENHGDHQAAGVLATEAFDMAGDPVAFPAQISGDTKRLEQYLENLKPWQPKKIYFFSDASDEKQFVGKGPAYSVREVSPSQKKPYWRLALDAAKPHLTQFPQIQAISKMSEPEVEKLATDPNTAWWSEPMTLIFGKAVVPTQPSDAIFPNEPRQKPAAPIEVSGGPMVEQTASGPLSLALGAPWGFYEKFRFAHKLTNLPIARTPEIALYSGSVVYVPLTVTRRPGASREITLKVTTPDGWEITNGAGKLLLPDEEITSLRVELQSPSIPEKDLKNRQPDAIVVTVSAEDKTFGEVRLNIALRSSALPQ